MKVCHVWRKHLHSGVQPQGFVDNSTQVLHVLHILKRRSARGPNLLQNLLAKATEYIRVLGQHVNGVGDAVGCLGENYEHTIIRSVEQTYSIAASKQDVENLVMKHSFILMEKSVHLRVEDK